MRIEQSLEEELELERQVRDVHNCQDVDHVKMLCASLVRQSVHQGKLLAQACNRIAELEAKLGCYD